MNEPPCSPAAATWWELFRELYFTFDRRTLGLARISIGTLFLLDLAHRGRDWWKMYSDEGVLPSYVVLAHRQADNFSIFHAFTTRGELWALWAVGVAIALALLLGFKTKAAQILALIYVTSMNGRLLLVENGGYVVENLVFLWSAFLPLGDRFSVDALRRSMRRASERTADELNDRGLAETPRAFAPFVSIVGLVLVVQIAAIYFFNVVHKTGPAWKNGTAVHYVLYVDRMVTPVVAAIREYLPGRLEIALTRFAIGTELALTFLAVMPVLRPWAKSLLVAGMLILHVGFGSTFVLGPFAWSCCCMATMMIPGEAWDWAEDAMRRSHRAAVVVFDEGAPGALFVCRVLQRLDRFELLEFAHEPGVRGLHVETVRARQSGAKALSAIVSALPLGPLVAWPLRLPGGRAVGDALARAIGGARADAWLEPSAPSHGFGESSFTRLGHRASAMLREVLAAAMFAAAINQALVELWVARPLHVPQPEAMRTLTLKLRFLQGWFMFSPNPVMDDGNLVVDAITVDGRHIDPFTERVPDFDLLHAKSFRYNQTWSDYKNRIQMPGNTVYRDAMKAYMLRLPERTGHADDALVSGEVYWVSDLNPRFGKTESTHEERKSIFSFNVPGRSVRTASLP